MTVHEAPDVKYATVVHVLPYAEDLEGVTGETFETFLQPFFEGEFKPVGGLRDTRCRQCLVGPIGCNTLSCQEKVRSLLAGVFAPPTPRSACVV